MVKFKVEKDELKVLGLDDYLWFGKFKDRQIRDLIEEEVMYIAWCLEKELFELDQDAVDEWEIKMGEYGYKRGEESEQQRELNKVEDEAKYQ